MMSMMTAASDNGERLLAGPITEAASMICAAVNCSIMAVAPGKRAAFYSAEGIACAVTDAVRMGVAAVGNAVMDMASGSCAVFYGANFAVYIHGSRCCAPIAAAMSRCGNRYKHHECHETGSKMFFAHKNQDLLYICFVSFV